ncbi:hypothetical protein [Microtetraspora sp. NBRC 16547]|uniref:hypothetical protein n=1 Tax=Microtetraspora sp. NBRC 16547 TaxID=3030993 RepID=UPI0024A2666C|nr:hypothetical protein [Microtetraspora sp. NBRC 16547]GLW97445.1 hypothetical protein Misp02_15320 [Microtetraspora sp. NBRC 16547]
MVKKTIATAFAGLAALAVSAAVSPAAFASGADYGTKTLALRKGLTLSIPSSWKVYKVAKDWTRVVTGSCPTAGTRSFGFRDSGCHSFWVMGPAAIKVGHEHFDPYTPDGPFYPASDVGPCVYDKKLWLGPMTLAGKGLRQVGPGHKAYYRAWSAECVSPKTHKVTGHFTQREWFLPKSKILVIDQWNTPGLPAILKNATWN